MIDNVIIALAIGFIPWAAVWLLYAAGKALGLMSHPTPRGLQLDCPEPDLPELVGDGGYVWSE